MTPLAHAGHWAAQILYLMPVLAMIGMLGWAKLRQRRHPADEQEAPPHRSESQPPGVRGP
jgi:hypothetical protein